VNRDPEQLKYLRVDYKGDPINESDLGYDPFELFKKWFDEAVSNGIREANAVNLATYDPIAKIISNRIVLIKQFDNQEFIFYTNYESQKSLAIANNPDVALNFYWVNLERQIRINGVAEKVTAEVSDNYFASRPRLAQIAASCSNQSKTIKNSNELLETFSFLEEQFKDKDIPRPKNWGGFAVKPNRFEFWQGRSSRLHDRIVFEYIPTANSWNRFRLAP
jgi:pyridoxamine 5'-phosphate oxidase